MTIVETQTWILTKSTGFPPNDFRLQLGQVLTNPRLPMQPLFPSSNSPPPAMPGMIVTETKADNVSLGRHSHLVRSFGLWANNSVVPVNAQLRAAEMHQTSLQWRLDGLVERASSFDRAHVKSVVKHPIVQDYIRSKRKSSLFWNGFPPLYIVTGLRIASGARMERASAGAQSGQAGLTVHVNPLGGPGAPGRVNAGLLAQASRVDHDHASFTRADDFIFAYQCSKINYFLTTQQEVYMAGDTQSIRSSHQPGHENDVLDVGNEPFWPEVFGAGEGDVDDEEILRDDPLAVILAEA